MILEVRKELDDAFIKLDRLLAIMEEKEEEFNFPVAFVSNLLYVCEKNGLSYLLEDHGQDASKDASEEGESRLQRSKRLLGLTSLIKKKIDFMHIEGLAHTVYALDKMGYKDEELWQSLAKQIQSREDGNFNVVYLKTMNANPKAFDYVGSKGGLLMKTPNEHMGQDRFNEDTQSLFFEDRYHLFEMKQGLLGAQDQGFAALEAGKCLDKLNNVLKSIDEHGEKERIMAGVSQVYQE